MLKQILPVLAVAIKATSAVTIAEINGNGFISPLNGTSVTGLKGLVTAIKSDGFFLRSLTPDDDPATSESLAVYGSAATKEVKVGDVITLDGKVEMYRSNEAYAYLTEFSSPENIVVVSSGSKVEPLVIGVDTTSPPTKDFSSLDRGGVFGVPNAVNTLSDANPTLRPEKFGLDFWQSLLGELVTIKDAYQVSRPNQYGDVWVRGDWKVTGLNGHGGLTMVGKDANPETIVIGTPCDGTSNPADTKMGDYLGNVTGVVFNAFGTYRVLPLTHIAPVRNASADFAAVSFESKGNCRGLTIADYNAENLNPESEHLPLVVDQIVNKLLLPDLVFLQEVQDDNGATNDGTTSANKTLTLLAHGIEDSSGVVYDFAEVDPINNNDGGQPGGNIRNAYLYRTDSVELYKPNQGQPLDENEVIGGYSGPELKYNPGRIDPTNMAWDESRKPTAAMWKPVKGTNKPFFTINVHMTSKGGSTSLHGDSRPPVNSGVEKRLEQTSVTADFISQILKKDPEARIVVAGDFNEFASVRPQTAFLKKSGLLDLNDVAGIDPVERYTYLFDMNSEELDHMYVSPALRHGAMYEHLHLNTWQNYDDQTSDHDPSVARLNFCGCKAHV